LTTSFVSEKIFRLTVQLIPIRAQEAIELMKQLQPLQDCGVTKPALQVPFTNKKYFLSILAGNTFPVQNHVTWWPAENQPMAPAFMPWIFGFEAGVRFAPANHYVSFEFKNNTQPAIIDSGSTRRDWIVINSTAIFYTYTFKLDKMNRLLIMPKIGIGYLNYVL